MTTEKPELKLQEVQQPMMVEQRQETIGWIGYTQRPINARTQTRNRYLDTTVFVSDITIPWNTLYDIPSYTKTTLSWNLNWRLSSSPWKIIIPVSWTYMVQWWLFISKYLWTDPITIYVDGITSYNNVEAKRWTTIPILFIKNFNKWDDIYISIDNSDIEDIEAVITLNIIKLS